MEINNNHNNLEKDIEKNSSKNNNLEYNDLSEKTLKDNSEKDSKLNEIKQKIKDIQENLDEEVDEEFIKRVEEIFDEIKDNYDELVEEISELDENISENPKNNQIQHSDEDIIRNFQEKEKDTIIKQNDVVLVTSALPYVNNIPHLGNLICVISADVFTRYLKFKGHKVISVCGTDEHGTTTETKAKQENKTPREICDYFYNIHKEIYDWFECDFDCFGRTSSETNIKLTQEIFLDLYNNKYIFEKEVSQYYCDHCNMFLADRFITGKCPYCGYENAKGDQCENCGKLLNPTDLIDPKCKFCGNKPILKQTKHLFLDLKALEPKIKNFVETRSKEGKWTINAINMTKSWLDSGLKPRDITRDLKWGVKVPLKDYEDKVLYSWFDAPIGYISITKENRTDWKEWWFNKDSENKVKLIQFMGKDNIPFHTIMFPGILLGTNKDYTLLYHISANEYLNYEDKQFSKSQNIGVFGDDAKKTKIKPDVWRYYLMINRPEKSDTTFTWEDLMEKNNNELVANLGNLVYRAVSFVNKFLNRKVEWDEKNDEENKKKIETINARMAEIYKYVDEYFELMDNIRLKEALRKTMSLSKKLNQDFQNYEPWKKIKENKQEVIEFMRYILNGIKELARMLYPFMPQTYYDILKLLNIDPKEDEFKKQFLGIITNQEEILFKKIENIDVFKRMFSGKDKKNKAGIKDKNKKIDETEKLKFRMNPDSILYIHGAKIIEVKDHPNADKLYVLKIQFNENNELKTRQLVAGLKKYYSKDELINKNIAVLLNLKPVELRGIKSEGMLLAAEYENQVKLIEPYNINSRLYFVDSRIKPKQEININEFIDLKIMVFDKRVKYITTILKQDNKEIIIDMPNYSIIR